MGSNDNTAKPTVERGARPSTSEPRDGGGGPSQSAATPEIVGDRLERPFSIAGSGGEDMVPGDRHHSEKPKPARFDFAGANQAHLKSMSAMRGKNAGPVKKSPTRR